MFKVLVSNDDGIDCIGFTCLVEALGRIADVYVAAPKDEQSGKSMGITFMREVQAQKRDLKGAVEAYAIDGTPADCVKWGLGYLANDGITPDYVVSGINMGYNLGAAIHYSATFAAAKEAALWGVRSIALSLGAHKATHFDYLLGLLPRLLEMSDKLDPSVILNVNAPDIPSWEVKGVKVCPAAPYRYSVEYLFAPAGGDMYQMKPGKRTVCEGQLFDHDWTDKGYVAVSPVPAEAGDAAALMKLSGCALKTDCLTVVIGAQTGTAGRIKKAGRFRRNTEKLVHAVSRMSLPVLMVESYDKGEVLPGLAAYTSETETVRHIHPDAWTSPDMEKYVAAADCQKVLIAGAYTNVEILQTVPGFIKRGFEVVILEDCCAASDKQSDSPAIETLKGYGCRISTLETEVMQLAGGCTKPVLESVKKILNK